jgi:signal transduction histidine kinase
MVGRGNRMGQVKTNSTDIENNSVEKFKVFEEQYIFSEKLLTKLLKDQESQNRYVSQELYHVIAQSLYSILLGLRMTIDSVVDESLKGYLKELEKSGDELLKKVKRLSFELYPLFIEDIGFVAALKADINFLRQEGINIKFQINETMENANYEKQLLFYQVTNEIMHFISKEVKSDRLKIIISFLEEMEDRFIFTFTNNSKALNRKSIEDSLVLTKKRLVGWNGEIQILNGGEDCNEWSIEAIIPKPL